MRSAFIISALAFIIPALSAPTVIPIAKRAGPVNPGSYIIKFKDGPSNDNPFASLLELLSSSGSSVTYDYRPLMSACAVNLKNGVLPSIQRLANVEYIEQDQIVSLSEHESGEHGESDLAHTATPEGHNELFGRTDEKSGEGVVVYGIDTGIYTEHKDFGGRASHGANFVGDGNDNDGNGHGTHTAATAVGTKYGVAKKAHVIAVKVLGADGSGSGSGVIAGIAWAVKHFTGSNRPPSIATMSLGSLFSQATNDAVKNGVGMGLHFTVAAGNDNMPADLYSPASVAEANTIGAVDSKNKKASFSNWGGLIDVWAPGVDIPSAWIGGPDSSKVLSGTSMATPNVAGIIATMIAKCPELKDPKVLSDKLRTNAKKTVTFSVADSVAGGLTPNKGLAQAWECDSK